MSGDGRRGITACVAALIAGLLLICGLWFAAMDDTLAMRTLPECATEDQSYPDCKWDARKHNGVGRSFYVRSGTVHYVK